MRKLVEASPDSKMKKEMSKMTNYYRVYGRLKGSDSRYKPMDMENGCLVTNLMHASFFPESDLPKLKREVESMEELNVDHEFQIRKVK